MPNSRQHLRAELDEREIHEVGSEFRKQPSEEFMGLVLLNSSNLVRSECIFAG